LTAHLHIKPRPPLRVTPRRRVFEMRNLTVAIYLDRHANELSINEMKPCDWLVAPYQTSYTTVFGGEARIRWLLDCS